MCGSCVSQCMGLCVSALLYGYIGYIQVETRQIDETSELYNTIQFSYYKRKESIKQFLHT